MNRYELKFYTPKGSPGTTHEVVGKIDIDAASDGVAILAAQEQYAPQINATAYVALWADDGRLVREWGVFPKR